MGTNDQDRRSPDTVLLKAIHALQSSLDKKHVENAGHLEMLQEKVDRIMQGFPNQDPDAHRRDHEASIAWREYRNEVVKETLKKVMAAGAIGSIGWLVVAIWKALVMSARL